LSMHFQGIFQQLHMTPPPSCSPPASPPHTHKWREESLWKYILRHLWKIVIYCQQNLIQTCHCSFAQSSKRLAKELRAIFVSFPFMRFKFVLKLVKVTSLSSSISISPNQSRIIFC
jgi:hypothetical protein